jgi:uncharacterized YigZ family protein
MNQRYPVPAVAVHTVQDTIKRSLFIAYLAHAPCPDSARDFIDSIRTRHADATHNCWAFMCGAPGDTARVGMSDDGEPHGTAGRPMLNVLLHGGVGEIAVVVTRYFGGTKLGTGGLVRAYGGMVSLGLESLPVREKIFPAHLNIIMEYTHVTVFKRLIEEHEAVVTHEEYAADAGFTITLPQENVAALRQALTELTNGTVLIEKAGEPA